MCSGDPEAWASSGNCPHHGSSQTVDEVLKPSFEPSLTLPPGLYRGLKAVLTATCGFAVSYATCMVRGYQPYDSNQFYTWADKYGTDLSVRLHNDDVHSYDEVSNALHELNFNEAKSIILTTAVDKHGAATLYTTSDTMVLETASNLLFSKNLLFSFLPEDIVKLDGTFVAIFNWMQALGMPCV